MRTSRTELAAAFVILFSFSNAFVPDVDINIRPLGASVGDEVVVTAGGEVKTPISYPFEYWLQYKLTPLGDCATDQIGTIAITEDPLKGQAIWRMVAVDSCWGDTEYMICADRNLGCLQIDRTPPLPDQKIHEPTAFS